MTGLAAPTVPVPIQVELFAGNDWRDVSSDVYWRQDINIQHGLSNETTSVQPSSCSFLLGNTSGNYDPANATGIYYGTIGMNTPVRVSILAHSDTFARTVASGWGTAADGDVWTTFGTGASSVTPGTGKITITAGQNVVAHSTAVWGDIDVAVTVAKSFAGAPTGGVVDAGVILRGASTTQYYECRFNWSVVGDVTVTVVDGSGGILIAQTVIVGLSSSTTSMRIRGQIERTTLRLKVWDASGPEPAGWMVSQTFNRNGVQALFLPGWVGVRGGSNAGNTNGTVTLSYSNFVVKAPRYAGNAFLQPTTDITGKDAVVSVTAGGPLRALQQGQQQISSPLTHDIPTAMRFSLLAYWPMEDTVPKSASAPNGSASGFSSGVPGGQVMAVASNLAGTQFASDSVWAGSNPLPVNNGSYWIGYTGSKSTNNSFKVTWLIHWPPAATLIDPTVVMRVHCTGTALRWDVIYHAGGVLDVQVVDNQGNVQSMGSAAFGVDGEVMRMSLWAQDNGVGGLSCQLTTLQQGVGIGGNFNPFTITGETVGTCYAVAVNPPGNALTNTSVGQVTVEEVNPNTSLNLFNLTNQFNGFATENADNRIERVFGYSNYDTGIEFGNRLPLQCGQQPQQSVFQIAQQTSDSDAGLLYDSKGDGACVMFVSGSRHEWSPAATGSFPVALSVTSHHLSVAPTPTYDDQLIRNDVTVSNWDGTSQEQSLTSGAMSTALPPNGVGDYPTQLQVDLQTQASLLDRAGWELNLGTNPAPRYPQIAVNLLRTGNGSIYWQMLDVRPDSFVTLAGWTADLLTLLARGYSEVLNSDKHQMVCNTMEGSRFAVPQLDDGASRAAAGASSLNAGITSTATSFAVKSTDGTLWTTSAGDFPLDVEIGGERMTVGTVTGTSSPQTFSSVTRSVNGVVKSHLAGESVQIATPLYLCLGRI